MRAGRMIAVFMLVAALALDMARPRANEVRAPVVFIAGDRLLLEGGPLLV